MEVVSSREKRQLATKKAEIAKKINTEKLTISEMSEVPPLGTKIPCFKISTP